VRMTAHKLVVDAARDVGHGECARFLGEDNAADRIERGVGAVLSKLGGTTAATMGHSTAEVGDLVAEHIAADS